MPSSPRSYVSNVLCCISCTLSRGCVQKVRKDGRGRAQLVLLDHGLYRRAWPVQLLFTINGHGSAGSFGHAGLCVLTGIGGCTGSSPTSSGAHVAGSSQGHECISATGLKASKDVPELYWLATGSSMLGSGAPSSLATRLALSATRWP